MLSLVKFGNLCTGYIHGGVGLKYHRVADLGKGYM